MKLIKVNKINSNKRSGIEIKKTDVVMNNIESFETTTENNANTKLSMVSGRDIYIQEDIEYIKLCILREG
jgi:hypothetical protein